MLINVFESIWVKIVFLVNVQLSLVTCDCACGSTMCGIVTSVRKKVT